MANIRCCTKKQPFLKFYCGAFLINAHLLGVCHLGIVLISIIWEELDHCFETPVYDLTRVIGHNAFGNDA